MNNERRKEIAKAITLVAEAVEMLRAVSEAELEAFESLPESLQDGERGQAMSGAADSIEGAADELENAIEGLSEFTA